MDYSRLGLLVEHLPAGKAKSIWGVFDAELAKGFAIGPPRKEVSKTNPLPRNLVYSCKKQLTPG